MPVIKAPRQERFLGAAVGWLEWWSTDLVYGASVRKKNGLRSVQLSLVGPRPMLSFKRRYQGPLARYILPGFGKSRGAAAGPPHPSAGSVVMELLSIYTGASIAVPIAICGLRAKISAPARFKRQNFLSPIESPATPCRPLRQGRELGAPAPCEDKFFGRGSRLSMTPGRCAGYFTATMLPPRHRAGNSPAATPRGRFPASPLVYIIPPPLPH
jgi:hypothetical protein